MPSRSSSSSKPTIAWVRDVPVDLCGIDLPTTPEAQVEELQLVEHWLSLLKTISEPSQWEPVEILQAAEVQQVKAMCEATGLRADPLPSAITIVDHVRSAAGSTWANLWRGVRLARRMRSVGVPYAEMVRDVAAAEKVSFEETEPLSSIEDKIIRNRFVRYMAGLSQEERQAVIARLKQVSEEHGRSFTKEAAAGGTLVIAEASGFGVYVLASTLVGTVSKALGLAIGFGFYTAMSQALSMAIPGGLAAVGGWTLYKITKPNLQKTTAAVLHIATMRLYAADLLEQKIRLLEKRKIHLVQRLGPNAAAGEGSAPKKKPWWRRLFG